MPLASNKPAFSQEAAEFLIVSIKQKTAKPQNRQVRSIFQIFFAVLKHLSPRRRQQLVAVFALMLVSAVADVVSLGLVLPLITVLIDPGKIFRYPLMQPIIDFLGMTNPQQLLLPTTLVFCVVVVIAGAVRVLFQFVNVHYAFAVGADLTIDAYRRTLYQPYVVQIGRNSGELIGGIIGKVSLIPGNLISPVTVLCNAVILTLMLLTALIAVDAAGVLAAIGGLGATYGLILVATRAKLRRNSKVMARESDLVVRNLQEGFGATRDILLNGVQEVFCKEFQRADRARRATHAFMSLLAAAPRYLVETLGMVTIALVAYALTLRDGGIMAALPVLAALVLAAQRLLPVFQQSFAAYSSLQNSRDSLHDALELLDQPMPFTPPRGNRDAFPFGKEICLKNLQFRYGTNGALVLSDANLSIAKGERIGIVGPTGGGKSTLLDLITGLLEPSEGSVEVDGLRVTSENRHLWQSRIAYVPQSIYLTDATIAENIAFAQVREEIDLDAVRLAAEQAQLADFIETLDEKYDARVGERGVRLSGGQRQRLGIARALYRRAELVIFDEATSALDSEMELAVMEAIYSLSPDLTIILVAHRRSTLDRCNRIIRVSGGRLSFEKTTTEIAG